MKKMPQKSWLYEADLPFDQMLYSFLCPANYYLSSLIYIYLPISLAYATTLIL